MIRALKGYTPPLSTFWGTVIVAYLAAVTGAVVVFTVWFFSHGISGFESATKNSLGIKMEHLAIMVAIFFVIGWIIAFFYSLLPFSFGLFLAIKLRIRSSKFFILCGVLTGLSFFMLFL